MYTNGHKHSMSKTISLCIQEKVTENKYSPQREFIYMLN